MHAPFTNDQLELEGNGTTALRLNVHCRSL